jgi:hypothetical protein
MCISVPFALRNRNMISVFPMPIGTESWYQCSPCPYEQKRDISVPFALRSRNVISVFPMLLGTETCIRVPHRFSRISIPGQSYAHQTIYNMTSAIWAHASPHSSEQNWQVHHKKSVPPKHNSGYNYAVYIPSRWPRDTLYPHKLALTSSTSGSHSVAIVRSRTKATEL